MCVSVFKLARPHRCHMCFPLFQYEFIYSKLELPSSSQWQVSFIARTLSEVYQTIFFLGLKYILFWHKIILYTLTYQSSYFKIRLNNSTLGLILILSAAPHTTYTCEFCG